MYLFSDRLEITSPERLPNPLTPDKIRYGTRAAQYFSGEVSGQYAFSTAWIGAFR